ncbi:unnamed protein product, partial [Ixodes hexagonus]
SSPPNIIFFLADDLGWADTSFRGNPQIPTPNLDVLASTGIILNNYYVQSVCTPSRGALMSGLYPIHTGLQHGIELPAEPSGLPLNFTIMPQYLKELGYTSHIVGKVMAYLAFWYHKESYTPTYRGFESFYGYYNGGEDYYTHAFYSVSVLLEPPHSWLHEPGSSLSAANDDFVLFLGSHFSCIWHIRLYSVVTTGLDSKPLSPPLHIFPTSEARTGPFLQVNFPHIYWAYTPRLDRSIGLVIESLHRKDMLKNSIIVFSTDNGALPTGRASNGGYNWPLRGAKGSLWEGAVRGASFVWSPLLSKSGRLSNQMMHITDWLPTLYSAA